MKHLLTLFTLASAGLAPLQAAIAPTDASQIVGETENVDSTEASLAKRIIEIATSKSVPRDDQDKLIAAAVQNAILAATEGLSDAVQIFAIASELAAVAAKAAPQFSETIVAAAASAPAVASIPDARARIQVVVNTAIRAAPSNAEFGGRHAATVVSPAR